MHEPVDMCFGSAGVPVFAVKKVEHIPLLPVSVQRDPTLTQAVG